MTPSTELRQQLNKLISEFPCVMIEQKDGKVYLLKEHWKYLRWSAAKRVLIGKGKISENRFEYLTEKFRVRTK
jgi:hypothetical protein